MTAAERKVRERYPDAKCDIFRNGRYVWAPLYGMRWWLGSGATRADAWRSAASHLTENPG